VGIFDDRFEHRRWKFRKHILTEGGWGEPMDQYLLFRGKQPTEIPLLRNRGLLK
ncbi:MAG: M3 family metallopeptidase, partial [Bacteroidales bacterium]|nr:M3 family metallopeptidase [Bacteroidales bacterium]